MASTVFVACVYIRGNQAESPFLQPKRNFIKCVTKRLLFPVYNYTRTRRTCVSLDARETKLKLS